MWNTNARGGNIVQIGYVKYKGQDRSYKVIDPGTILKGFISWVSLPHMNFLYLTVQMLWPRLKEFFFGNRQTDTHRNSQAHKHTAQKNRCPRITFRGIKKEWVQLRERVSMHPYMIIQGPEPHQWSLAKRSSLNLKNDAQKASI